MGPEAANAFSSLYLTAVEVLDFRLDPLESTSPKFPAIKNLVRELSGFNELVILGSHLDEHVWGTIKEREGNFLVARGRWFETLKGVRADFVQNLTRAEKGKASPDEINLARKDVKGVVRLLADRGTRYFSRDDEEIWMNKAAGIRISLQPKVLSFSRQAYPNYPFFPSAA